MNELTHDNEHIKRCVEQVAGPANEGQAALLDALLKQDVLPAILRQIIEGKAMVEVLFCGHGDEDDTSGNYWFDPTPGHHLSTLPEMNEDVLDWFRAEGAACHFYAMLGQDGEWRYYLGSAVKDDEDVDKPVAALLGWTGLTITQRRGLLADGAERRAA